MKAVYIGAVKGYQSPVYRPGMGWSNVESHGRLRRQSAVFKKNQLFRPCPLSVVRRRRPGVLTKLAIITALGVAIAVLTWVLYGGAQL